MMKSSQNLCLPFFTFGCYPNVKTNVAIVKAEVINQVHQLETKVRKSAEKEKEIISSGSRNITPKWCELDGDDQK